MQTDFLAKLRSTLDDVDQGLRFRQDPVAMEFRVFLVCAIAELERKRLANDPKDVAA